MVIGFTTTDVISAYHHWWCEFESPSGRGVQHYVIDKVCQRLATCRWFSLGPPVSSTNKTDCNDIAVILLKVKQIILFVLQFTFSCYPIGICKHFLCYLPIPSMCTCITIKVRRFNSRAYRGVLDTNMCDNIYQCTWFILKVLTTSASWHPAMYSPEPLLLRKTRI
jgi:hypothetical protein